MTRWFVDLSLEFERVWSAHVDRELERRLTEAGLLMPGGDGISGNTGPVLVIHLVLEAADRDAAIAAGSAPFGTCCSSSTSSHPATS